MKHLVSLTLIPGEKQAIAERMPAEQVHFGGLRRRGVFEQIYVAADRSGLWVMAEGESQDDVQQTMSTLPLYPCMRIQITPLLMCWLLHPSASCGAVYGASCGEARVVVQTCDGSFVRPPSRSHMSLSDSEEIDVLGQTVK